MNFPFNEDIILENKRALLRPVDSNDVDLLFSIATEDKNLLQYSPAPVYTRELLQEYIDKAIRLRQDHQRYTFTVFDKKENAYAGCTRFYDINLPYKTIQLGYTWYGKKFHGTGLNKHCKFLLLQFAFEVLALERFELRADARNEKSIAAMKSIGCKVDGILRKNMPTIEGERRDSIVLSILKDEWFNDVKEMLMKKLKAY